MSYFDSDRLEQTWWNSPLKDEEPDFFIMASIAETDIWFIQSVCLVHCQLNVKRRIEVAFLVRLNSIDSRDFTQLLKTVVTQVCLYIDVG